MGGTVFLLTSGAVYHGDEGKQLLCVGSKARQGPQVSHC